MSTVTIVLLVILVILIAALIGLYFFGKKAQKKQEEQQAQIEATKQTVSMLVIDKKRMPLKESGLPQMVIDQTPKLMRRSKLPIVKAKVGPRISILIADEKIFDLIPVKKEIKEPKAVSEKPRQPKPVKERAAKEKQPREFREPKEKQVREKTTKPVKPVEILTDPEEIKEVENRAKVFLRDVFASMNLGEVEITSEYNTTDGSLEVDFEGEDMGILIGKRGQTLDSLQYLTSLVVNKGKSNYIRVKLDTEDYRKRRKETLENLARGIAYKVRKTRKPVILEPMNPYERRIIHATLQNDKYVATRSEGEEPYRKVIVYLKKK